MTASFRRLSSCCALLQQQCTIQEQCLCIPECKQDTLYVTKCELLVNVFVNMLAGAHQQAHWKLSACTLLVRRAEGRLQQGQKALRVNVQKCATPCLAMLATHLRIDNQPDPKAVSSIVICIVNNIQASPASSASRAARPAIACDLVN